MFQRKTKKKAPPRPPPPNLNNHLSTSTSNLTQQQNLLEWTPPSSPKQEAKQTFGGSVSSSYSSSASSLTSSKKSFENDINSSLLNWTTSESKEISPNLLKPRIIRTQHHQQSHISKTIQKEVPRDVSPPMPSIPPPSPPKGDSEIITPYGIALYDFRATQPGDLPLQVADVVILLRRVNKDWLFGRVGDLEGIFPQNYIRIKVPLPEANQTVTVLNEYNPHLPDMLPLKPGQKVRIISEISTDWLYGEIDGTTGQFPRNCVMLNP